VFDDFEVTILALNMHQEGHISFFETKGNMPIFLFTFEIHFIKHFPKI